MTRRLAILLMLFATHTGCVKAGPARETANVIDAQQLELAGKRWRLPHIHTPRPGDVCAFKDRQIDCGLIAKTALQDLTAGAVVVCDTSDGLCRAGGYDLSEGMIYTGWARAAKDAPAKYKKLEKDAKARRRGLWQGAFPASVNDKVD